MKQLFELTLEPVDSETLAALEGLVHIKSIKVVDSSSTKRKSTRPPRVPGQKYRLDPEKSAKDGSALFCKQVLIKYFSQNRSEAVSRADINTVLISAIDKDGRYKSSGVSSMVSSLIRDKVLCPTIT